MTPSTLAPHQIRLLDEQQQLSERVSKLREFTASSDIFLGLPLEQQQLLTTQLEHMVQYEAVLNERVLLDVGKGTYNQDKVEFDHIQSLLDSCTFQYARIGDTTTTVCEAFLPNGFSVGSGKSACVDPNNYNYDDGCKYARERALVEAKNTLWQLEGYLLKVTGKTSDRH